MRRHLRILVAAGFAVPAACAPAPVAHKTSAPPPTAGPRPVSPGADAAGRPSEDAATSSAEPAPTTTTQAPEPTTTVTITVPTTTTHTHAPVTTTFVLPEAAEDDLSDEEWWKGQAGYVAEPGRAELLACIRSYEQNDNPRAGPTGYASDTGNGFYGAYQFDLSTWRSVGGSGNPAHASAAEQDERAWALYLSRGLSPWPTPARRCG